MASLGIDIKSLIHGSIGNVVIVRRQGKIYVRKKPKKSTRAPTEAQIQHLSKFKLVVTFLKRFRDVIEIGYTNVPIDMFGFNQAVGENFKNSVKGENLNYHIDISKLKITSGKMHSPDNAIISMNENNLYFKWTLNAKMRNANTILVAYCCNSQRVYFAIVSNLTIDGIASISIPKSSANGEIHTWLSYMSENKQKTSDSYYSGCLIA